MEYDGYKLQFIQNTAFVVTFILNSPNINYGNTKLYQTNNTFVGGYSLALTKQLNEKNIGTI